MGDENGGWWLGKDRLWRQGAPPPGWTQARDGRWQPLGDAVTQELDVLTGVPAPEADAERPARNGAHAPSKSKGNGRSETDRERYLRLLRSAAPVSLVALVLAIMGGVIIATKGLGADANLAESEQQADASQAPGLGQAVLPPGEATDTPGDAAGGDTRATTSTTSADRDDQTATSPEQGEDPPVDETTTTTTASDPFAACEEAGIRIPRGDHDMSWYLEHFDRDGDGILCN